jgi:hypothetical protein
MIGLCGQSSALETLANLGLVIAALVGALGCAHMAECNCVTGTHAAFPEPIDASTESKTLRVSWDGNVVECEVSADDLSDHCADEVWLSLEDDGASPENVQLLPRVVAVRIPALTSNIEVQVLEDDSTFHAADSHREINGSSPAGCSTNCVRWELEMLPAL